MENRYLLATDAAKALGCSSQNIRQLEKAGTLKAAFNPGAAANKFFT